MSYSSINLYTSCAKYTKCMYIVCMDVFPSRIASYCLHIYNVCLYMCILLLDLLQKLIRLSWVLLSNTFVFIKVHTSAYIFSMYYGFLLSHDVYFLYPRRNNLNLSFPIKLLPNRSFFLQVSSHSIISTQLFFQSVVNVISTSPQQLTTRVMAYSFQLFSLSPRIETFWEKKQMSGRMRLDNDDYMIHSRGRAIIGWSGISVRRILPHISQESNSN